jgi:hypothetical protein
MDAQIVIDVLRVAGGVAALGVLWRLFSDFILDHVDLPQL